MFVTEKTVKFHLTNIYKKMDVKSRAQLIVWCMPHTQFVNQNQPNQNETVNPKPQQFQEPQTTRTPVNTIPAGSTTVSSNYRNPIKDYRRGNSDKGNSNGPFGV